MIKRIYSKKEIRNILLNLSTEDFFKHYVNRKTYEEIPLLMSDGIVIPEIGLKSALSSEKLLTKFLQSLAQILMKLNYG